MRCISDHRDPSRQVIRPEARHRIPIVDVVPCDPRHLRGLYDFPGQPPSPLLHHPQAHTLQSLAAGRRVPPPLPFILQQKRQLPHVVIVVVRHGVETRRPISRLNHVPTVDELRIHRGRRRDPEDYKALEKIKRRPCKLRPDRRVNSVAADQQIASDSPPINSDRVDPPILPLLVPRQLALPHCRISRQHLVDLQPQPLPQNVDIVFSILLMLLVCLVNPFPPPPTADLHAVRVINAVQARVNPPL
mmetsp:Transcript_9211/g.32584  ORF Transcript_9211/g.32584 Transcript_9211/m.32584 type:complete len:246 (+) Transcript_9211:1116-1853(+)